MSGGAGRGLGRRTTVGIVVVAALLTGALGWAIARDHGPSVHTGSGDPSEDARCRPLDGGRAGCVVVSASDDLRVWWRDRGEKGWSAPEVIEGGSDRFLWGTDVRVAGTTVAIRARYNNVPPWADEPPPGLPTSVFIVCQAGSCVVSDHYEQVQEPQCRRGSCRLRRPRNTGVNQVPELSSDGSQVLFGATESGYVAWSVGAGLRELEPEHLPTDGVLGTPMLAPDGSLRLAVGRAEGAACRLTLYTSPPVKRSTTTLEYTEQVSTRAPTRSGDCATTLEGFTSDQVLVHSDRFEPAYLVRVGDTWKTTTEDPTGMVRYQPLPGRQAAGSAERTGYWHGREVVTASPDGRRIVAQVHFPGTAGWTDPVSVAASPRGRPCFEIAPTSTPGSDPFYVSMTCRSRPSPGAEWTYVGVHAVTEDGRTWASVVGDHLPTRVGQDLHFGGRPAHRWTPDGGLTEIDLPVPANSRTFQVDDGTVVLVTARPLGSRCRLEVRVAAPEVTQWSAPLTNPDPFVPPEAPCRPVGQYDGTAVSLYFRTDGPQWLAARVTRSGGQWVITPRRPAG